jgi:hypothetical protein
MAVDAGHDLPGADRELDRVALAEESTGVPSVSLPV